ncbi:hypothetical protein [Bradyrhizobium sp. ORS 86]|uniref:hypothetical protein n=1 Tax=Bradyrhizobium sp. ORS 86 TaxID=1685970 RepID=UPI00388E53AE
MPWRLIGERVAMTVAAGEMCIRHGMREVAIHKQSDRRRCGSSTGFPVAMARSADRQQRQSRHLLHCPRCCVLLPNTKQRSEGASNGAPNEGCRSADSDDRAQLVQSDAAQHSNLIARM